MYCYKYKNKKMMENKTIAVIGATGLQGKGVVNALVREGTFNVRAITRNPDNYSGKAQEVIKADLTDLNLFHCIAKILTCEFWIVNKRKLKLKHIGKLLPYFN